MLSSFVITLGANNACTIKLTDFPEVFRVFLDAYLTESDAKHTQKFASFLTPVPQKDHAAPTLSRNLKKNPKF